MTMLETAPGRRVWASSEPRQPVNGLRFSPGGKLLALALGDCSKGTPGDRKGRPGEVQVWDWRDRKLRARLTGWTRGRKTVAFGPDGKLMATGNGDGDVWLWDPASHGLRTTFRAHKQNIPALAFSPDGRILAAANADGSIKLWDVSEPTSRPD